jgi:hypothetical protein
MPKLTYSAAKGLVQETGAGVTLDGSLFSVGSLPFSPTQAITTAATVTSPGVYTIAGTTTQIVMPLAATFPGATFVFRSASASAHVLTGSAETVTTPAFTKVPGATNVAGGTGIGSRLTLPAVVGSSVVLLCDGNRFIVAAASGSFVLDQTVPA